MKNIIVVGWAAPRGCLPNSRNENYALSTNKLPHWPPLRKRTQTLQNLLSITTQIICLLVIGVPENDLLLHPVISLRSVCPCTSWAQPGQKSASSSRVNWGKCSAQLWCFLTRLHAPSELDLFSSLSCLILLFLYRPNRLLYHPNSLTQCFCPPAGPTVNKVKDPGSQLEVQSLFCISSLIENENRLSSFSGFHVK